MGDVKVFVGDHGAATVVFAFADNVDLGDVEGVGVADDGADIEIVREVFDGDFERNAGFVEVGNNFCVGQAFIFVD